MKNKLLQTILFVGASAVSADLSAQQSLNVTSHSIQINGQTFDYSIGEMTLVNTEKTSSLIVTQGFLQPNTQRQESSTTSDNAFSQLDNPIKVYPNPTTNLLYIESYESGIIDYAYNLYDATGKIVLNQKGQTQQGINKWELSLQSLASGSYYLMMQKNDSNGQSQHFSYKIQKIN